MNDLPADAGANPDLGPYGRLLLRASTAFAAAGGLLFVALVAMSIVSIAGRKLFSAPVPGDVELLQATAAFASSAFFALCHMKNGDVKVDFFTAKAGSHLVGALDAIGSMLVGAFGLLIAWRTGVGAIALKDSGETTMILSLPIWISQMLMVPGFVLLGIVGFYMAGAHWRTRVKATNP